MGSVPRCERCGRLGHVANICATPLRYEGTCDLCGQFGHRWYRCVRNRSAPAPPHANVMASPPHSSGSDSNSTRGGVADDGGYTLVSPEEQLAEFDRNSNNIAVNDSSGYSGDNARGDGNNGVPFAGDAGGQHHGYDGVDDGGYVHGNGYDGAGEGGYTQDLDGTSPPGSFGTHGDFSAQG